MPGRTQPWCTGAAHFFCDIGVPGTVTPGYLGTMETKPVIEGQHKFEQVMNDLSGAAPFDFSFLGEVAVISGVLTRFNELAYQAATAPVLALGSNGALEIGTLMATEGAAGALWVTYPYSAKTAMAGLETGRHYLQTILFDPHRIEIGTRAKKISVTWLAWSKYNPTTGGFTLFDYNFAGLPATE